MDKQHLKRRHNVYWVRVWVPKPVRETLGKSELWQNLYTTDLAEANRKKHRVVAELMEVIEQAKRDLDGTLDKVSREEKLKEFALEYTRGSDVAKNDDDEDVEDLFEEADGKCDHLWPKQRTFRTSYLQRRESSTIEFSRLSCHENVRCP